ncbi:DUF2490 domain-containing protein [Niabella drilacis]|uniref:DUF2490 domain-containing protein n=1 Tax=Niabella drilacis (strain DSM 25811 / CCM 8410 / CCUG 62505 / LMG 26954 / E90) TaxID=1285928 RepID=A0A1G6I656_NIADE|nr:DUF2490 domain-containing protein [Niabella drilacis]SDC01843.1 Protein of unknown function [Niabella drilacis]
MRILFSLILLLIADLGLKAQDVDGKTSFFLAGASADINRYNKTTVYGGYSPTDDIKALIVLSTFTMNRFLSLTPGYTFVNTHPESGNSVNEHQITSFVTINYPFGKKWVITDRNMFYHRFRQNAPDLSFYRNRLGIAHYISLFKKQASLFVHDEMYLSLNGNGLTRNRAIVGADIKLFRWINPQIMYMYQTDRVGGSRHLGLFVLTTPLCKSQK